MWSGAVARGKPPMLARFAGLWIPSGSGKPPAGRAKSLRPGSARTEALHRNSRKHRASQLEIYFWAVTLVSMFTTCTRRLASASGWLGSFSLLLP